MDNCMKRSTSRSDIRILSVAAVEEDMNKERKKMSMVNGTYTKDIIHKEVLTPQTR